MTVQPFTIDVSQEVLDDLNKRLARTRWTDEVDGAGWDYGTNLAYLKELVTYWKNDYDWRTQEAKLNEFSHFHADVDGVGIHFIHEKGKGPNPMPLLLTHGWPDSFYRMVKIIPMLTDPARFDGDPADSFDVIVPSVPGHGFSDRVDKGGMSSYRTAELWATLMHDVLGYEKFAAMGGDVGSEVTLHLARLHPEYMVGIHLTDVSYPQAPPDGSEPGENAYAYFEGLGKWFSEQGAYMMIQSTKPQTLAYGLNDSPVGLASWIIEKFQAWGDTHGDIESRFSKDELLTNIMIYWVTETVNSAARRYYEGMHGAPQLWPGDRIEVPTAIAQFPTELLPPRDWLEEMVNLQRYTTMSKGGHFAALEEPKLLANDLREFFRAYR